MDFLRRQVFYIICTVASVAGIALGITGLKAMPAVVAEMEKTRTLYQDLKSLESNPANVDAIEAERRRIQQTLEDRDKVIEKVHALYDYEPLVADALPEGNDDDRRLFCTSYAEAMQRLFDSLHSGEVATPIQIDQMRDIIENERAEQERGLSGETLPGWASGPPRNEAGVLTRAGARVSPEARAHMAAAQRIFCYAARFDTEIVDAPQARLGTRPVAKAIPSLDYDGTMKISGAVVDAPLPEEVWRAQVGYWIQKDIVAAIVAVNEEAAGQVEARGERPWVGNLPVKDVISIRVSQDYVLPGGERYAGAPPGDFTEALPPASADAAFTRTASSPLFEVKQFTVKLIMDQRDIQRFLEELSRRGFHTPFRVAYKSVPPNKDMNGKIYGSEPVVNVVMDFETIMLGSFFRRYMPAAVCQTLAEAGYGIQCPQREAKEEG